MTGSGTVTASIAAGVAHDAAGNPNAASTSTDNAVTYQEPPITYVENVGSVASNSAGTTLQIPVGAGGVTTGNTIIVGFASRGASTYNAPAVSDSGSNTYYLATNAITYAHGRAYLFYAHVGTALGNGSNITITTSSVSNRVAVASVFRGLMATNVLDQVLNNPTGTSTTTNGNNPTVGPTGPTVQANELIIGVIGTEEATDAGVGTWQNGFSAGPQVKSSGTTTYEWRVSLGYKIVSATGTFTAAKIVTNNPYWAATIATFKAGAVSPPTIAQQPQSTAVCAGGTATFSVTATGTGPLSYQWQTNTVNISNGGHYSGVTSNVLTVFPASVTDAASYRCLVTNAGGSVTSSVATLTVNARPTSVVSGSATICNGGTTTIQAALTGTGPWNLTWSDGTNQNGVASSPATRNVSPSATTTYTATALSDANCTAQAGDRTGSAVVTVNSLPTVFNVAGGGAYCAGRSGVAVDLNGSQSGVNYQLLLNSSPTGSPVAGTGSAISFGSQTAAGSYTVVASNTVTGCTVTMSGSATITVNPTPSCSVSPSNATICAVGSQIFTVTPSGGTPGYTYLWSNGSTGTSITTNVAGTYSVTVTDSKGCTTMCSATLTVNPTPTIFNVTGGGAYCAGGSGVAVGLDGSQSGVNYQLLLNASPTGSPVAGTDSPVSFGNQTVGGAYTVMASNVTTSCTAAMTSSTSVTLTPSFQCWQLQYFGCTNCPQAAANADPDGDGMSNTNEFLTGFNPTNNAAYLHVVGVVKTANDINVTYLGANGDTTWTPGVQSCTNILEYSTGTTNGSYSNNFVSAGVTNILSGGTGLGTNVTAVDTGGATNVPSRYYRIRVLVP